MHQDDPSISNLLEPTGKKVTPGNPLDSSEIAKFFIKRGYEVMGVNQIWKSITGHVKKDGVEYYLKLANGEGSYELLSNEISWNDVMQRSMAEKGFDKLIVPEIIDKGEYNGSIFFVTKYYFGSPLANKHYTKVGDIEKYVETIVDVASFIDGCEGVLLSIDSKHKPNDQLKEQEMSGFIGVAKGYVEVIKENDMAQLLSIVDEYKKSFEFSLCHNSFEPKEMIPEGEKIVLIDAEKASAYSPKYFDIAYFFTKCYVAAGQPAVAKDFIHKFRDRLAEDKREDFDRLVRPSLALSAIHCYMKSEVDANHFFDFHNRFAEELNAGLPY